MDYSNYVIDNSNLILTNVDCFKLADTLDCGQAFRWRPNADGSYSGVAFGRSLTISQRDNEVTFHNTSKEDFENIWKDYFDFNRDYKEVQAVFKTDSTMNKAIDYADGIRVLQQDPWEALCSFIFSQNNNVKRIQGIVDRFAENFGEQLSDGSYSFPLPDKIAALTIEDLAPVRAGFRAKYIVDAATCVASGRVSLTSPYAMSLDDAREHLMQIKGVGPKVADCVLLFGFSRLEAFPRDVWIKRALEVFYPHGFPENLVPWGGLAQQYLFHYVRTNPDIMPEDTN